MNTKPQSILYISAAKDYCSAFISGRYVKLADDDVRFLSSIGYTFQIFCAE